MAMQSITLTASMRTNLASLKSIQSQMDSTQERLSTGKKVNSAIDNATSYYQSRSLTNRASDLESLLDSMGQGIQTIEAANQGIEAVTSYIEQLKSVANSAYALDPNSSSYENQIQSYMEQFNTIQDEIEKLIDDSSYQGVNLLKNGTLTVTFNETRTNKFVVQGQDVITGMNISGTDTWTAEPTGEKKNLTVTKDYTVGVVPATTIKAGAEIVKKDSAYYAQAEDGKYYELEDFDGTDLSSITGAGTTALGDASGITNVQVDVKSYMDSIDKTLTSISDATDYLRSYANELGNNYSIIQTRQDFTEAMIDVLETGSDNLVLADMNEESANYLALQTRQQLAINSLSLASQSAQSILSLF